MAEGYRGYWRRVRAAKLNGGGPGGALHLIDTPRVSHEGCACTMGCVGSAGIAGQGGAGRGPCTPTFDNQDKTKNRADPGSDVPVDAD